MNKIVGFQWIMHLSEKMSYRLHMQYKGSSVQIFLYLLFQVFFLIKRNKISNTSMKRYV